MISTYRSQDTRTVTIRGKEVIEPTSMLDYSQSNIGADLKEQLLYSYLAERKQINK
jgi:hypothetical protein